MEWLNLLTGKIVGLDTAFLIYFIIIRKKAIAIRNLMRNAIALKQNTSAIKHCSDRACWRV
ncbi:MAG: hypothetical protein RLZZ535_1339 [Cyanobacteriota bacterium]|jgi:hypothetical protein